MFLSFIALSNERTCLESFSGVFMFRLLISDNSSVSSSSSSSFRSLGFKLILLKKMRILLNSFCFSSSCDDLRERLLWGRLNARKLEGKLGGMIF